MEKFRVVITFTEPLLGTVPLNKELYEDYIATKAPEETDDELDTVPEMVEKGTTGFHEIDGKPVLVDYIVRGFFKGACGNLRRVSGTLSEKLRAYKKEIDGLIFVFPRFIPINLSGEMGVLTRPLRASTAQGERITLARSIMVPAGSTIEFTVLCLKDGEEKQLREWLAYGAFVGLGCWRGSGGYGRFTYEMEREGMV